MSDDPGRYLVNMGGLAHELLGGDPEQIVLRASRIGEGSASLRDLAHELRAEADRYERLQATGWRLVGSFRAGEARCEKTAAGGDATGSPAAAHLPQPPSHLQAVVEGADSLPDAAGRLRRAAEVFEGLRAEGRDLAVTVVQGRVRLE